FGFGQENERQGQIGGAFAGDGPALLHGSDRRAGGVVRANGGQAAGFGEGGGAGGFLGAGGAPVEVLMRGAGVGVGVRGSWGGRGGRGPGGGLPAACVE